MKYRAQWKANSLNIKYWNEVLRGRTISRLKFDRNGLRGLVLDSGETLFLYDSTTRMPAAWIKVE
jgi:hypothetical protein